MIKREDQDLEKEILEVNTKIKTFFESKGLYFIDNSNLDSSCLNRGKLHLNRKGTAYLARNIRNAISNILILENESVEDNSDSTNSQSFSDENNIKDNLQSYRVNNAKDVVVSYLNINSIQNKFDSLQEIIGQNRDILTISETKLDMSFPTTQFMIPGYHKPYRIDVSNNSGGILVYVKSSLPSHQLTKFCISSDILAIPFEINLRKEKWLFVSIYKPPSLNNRNMKIAETLKSSYFCFYLLISLKIMGSHNRGE